MSDTANIAGSRPERELSDPLHAGNVFQFCPRCGQQGFSFEADKRFRCNSCNFVYYLNQASSTAAIIEKTNGDILIARRKYDPGKGMLDLPGGFIDNGESAENGILREVEEEIGVRPTALRFFRSYPNRYHFGGILYYTLDLVFICTIPSDAQCHPNDDISEILTFHRSELPLELIAFDSLRQALVDYLQLEPPTR